MSPISPVCTRTHRDPYTETETETETEIRDPYTETRVRPSSLPRTSGGPANPAPRGRASLKDQGCRAADSIVLNIAEGRGRGGGAGKNHFRIALGSAAELSAVLDLLEPRDGASYHPKIRRIGAMLARLSR